MVSAVAALSLLISGGCASRSGSPAPEASADPRFDWFGYRGEDAVFRDSAAGPGEYQNPILTGFYPDPSITRAGDDYYLVHSTFAYFPGIPVFHSRDLVSWRQIGNVIDRPTQLDFDSLGLSRGVFAPTIEHHQGTFYGVVTLRVRKSLRGSLNPPGSESSPYMPARPTAQHCRRFPAVVIHHAVWLYLRFPLSLRDVEELLAERGIKVSYESVRRWVATYGPRIAAELRRREAQPGRIWHLDEMAVRIGGKQHWLWRAVDENGAILDVLLEERRDTEAAERFFRTLLGHTGSPPERMTTDKLGSYAAANQRILELDGVEHQQVRSSMRCNNRVEQAHQPTRVRERRMGRFRCPISAQRFLSAFVRVCNLFRPRRHLLRAAEYRATLQERFAIWGEVTALMAV